MTASIARNVPPSWETHNMIQLWEGVVAMNSTPVTISSTPVTMTSTPVTMTEDPAAAVTALKMLDATRCILPCKSLNIFCCCNRIIAWANSFRLDAHVGLVRLGLFESAWKICTSMLYNYAFLMLTTLLLNILGSLISHWKAFENWCRKIYNNKCQFDYLII